MPKKPTADRLDYTNPLFDYRSSVTHNDIVTYEMAAQWVEDFMTACLPEKGQPGTEPLVIIDSISNLPTGAQVDAKQGDVVMAAQARANSQWFRTVWVLLKEANGVMVMAEQLTANIGHMPGQSASMTGGGYKISYLAQTVVELAKVKQLSDPKTHEVTGHIIGVRIPKNRWDTPARRTEYVFSYENHVGLDHLGEIIALGVRAGVISYQKSGGFYTFSVADPITGEITPVKLHGAAASREWLSERPDIAADLERQIRITLGTGETDLPATFIDDELLPQETEE